MKIIKLLQILSLASYSPNKHRIIVFKVDLKEKAG